MNIRNGLLRAACAADGGVATIFALSVLALLAVAGLSIDYARFYSAQSRIQADLDTAVLGAATQAGIDGDIQAAAQAFFNENWRTKHGVESVELAVTKSGDNRIVASVTATLPTTLMAIAGFESMPIRAATEVELAGQHVEVSLVLDTTLSMSGAKLDSLKEAARSLIDRAYEAPKADETVKIGIVPFAQYVNVGLSNRNASWMSVPPDSSVTHTECRTVTPVTGTANCRMETFTGYNDGTPYSYQAEVCDYLYGPPVEDCTPWTETSTWNGCVGSRNNPLDIDDIDYTNKVPGLMNAGCGAEITPLTNDADALKSQIDALVATGDTYIPAGLMWGWTTLSKAAPYEEAAGYGEKVDGMPVRKIMVLMSDGANTLYPSYPYHDTELSGAQANALTGELCANIDAEGIEIYTVAFGVENEDIKDVLRACAKVSSRFFDAPTAEDLASAFSNIAKSFSPLRLTR